MTAPTTEPRRLLTTAAPSHGRPGARAVDGLRTRCAGGSGPDSAPAGPKTASAGPVWWGRCSGQAAGTQPSPARNRPRRS